MGTSQLDAPCARYTSGEYLQQTGGKWHLQDSPFKARQVLTMLRRNNIAPQSICEVGCGAGGILSQLQQQMPDAADFVGYEISPQAHQISQQFANDRLRFHCRDAFADQTYFDLVLAMDVVEHVEDCYGFLRQLRDKGCYKLYHFPLEISVLTCMRESRGLNSWRTLGHIHRFTLTTALEAVRYTGQEVVDHFLTPGSLDTPKLRWRTALANVPRRILKLISPTFTQRLLGGSSALILAR
jgi:hypothetical protein